MNNNQQKNHIIDKVFEKIKSGEVKMRPRACFVLKTLLVVLGIIAITLFVLYLISFIAFVLRASGVWFLPGFGLRGIKPFLFSVPWLLILTAGALIVVLEILVKRFAFSYRRPILYSILAIIAVVFLGGFIIDRTQFHVGLFQQAREGHLPVAGGFYRGFGMPEFHDVHSGVVSEITDNGFLIETREGQTLAVIVTSETRFPSGMGIKESDAVMILGERDNGIIQASDIRKIKDDLNIFPRGRTPEPHNILAPYRMPILPAK